MFTRFGDEASANSNDNKISLLPAKISKAASPVRKSIIGPQEEIINGVLKRYKGGAWQYNFTEKYSGIRGKVNNWEKLFKEDEFYTKKLQ